MTNKIIPAILEKSYEKIEDKVYAINRVASEVQIDICDGLYTETKTWPFNDMSSTEFIAIGTNPFADVYLPYWQKIEYSADLMCINPSLYINSLISYGFEEVIFHFNTLKDESEILEIYKKCQFAEIKFCLAIDMSTNLDLFLETIKLEHLNIDTVQIMGIEKIGKQGQVFDMRVLEIIKKVRNFIDQNNLETNISVDGGMTDDSINECSIAGADSFAVGSFLFNAENIEDEYKYLESI